jgi:ribonucleoside-diphosphate reductase subunit M1
MKVINRKGESVLVEFDRITDRIREFVDKEPALSIDPVVLTQRVISGMKDSMSTAEIDELTALTAAAFTSEDPEYDTLAVRALVSNLHKTTHDNFSSFIEYVNEVDTVSLGVKSIVEPRFARLVRRFADQIDNMIVDERDYEMNYIGFRVLAKSYLVRSSVDNRILERPQYMYMRSALYIHLLGNLNMQDDELRFPSRMNWDRIFDDVKTTYDHLSLRYYTHATPTLMNSGLITNQTASCFVMNQVDDSIEGIMSLTTNVAHVSKACGGIGINFTPVRGANAYISGTGGRSNGIVPYLKVLNSVVAGIDQGGGKRKGVAAVYLEMFHPDLIPFIELRLPSGNDSQRTRDLFIGLFICDLFMKRAYMSEMWTFFDPSDAPELFDTYGEEFEEHYLRYEEMAKDPKKKWKNPRSGTTMDAHTIMRKIIDSQLKSGMPYMTYKDSINRKSGQLEYGKIRQPNLCTEIMQISTKTDISQCNLASVCLPKFANPETKEFSFVNLGRVVREIVRNLNLIMRVDCRPEQALKHLSLDHPLHNGLRKQGVTLDADQLFPIGIGIQGLADLFMMFDYPYDSKEAMQLNHDISECMYANALHESAFIYKNWWKLDCSAPPSYPVRHKTHLQMDLWKQEEADLVRRYGENIGNMMLEARAEACRGLHQSYNWAEIQNYIENEEPRGVMNTLVIAHMPSASVSYITGCNPSSEPRISNKFACRVLAGEFVVVNQYLVKHLKSKGMWNKNIQQRIIAEGGSVQKLNLDPHTKLVYRTAWEIPQKKLLQMAYVRGLYVDQSQSTNLFCPSFDAKDVLRYNFYTWMLGLKNTYYLRTPAPNDASMFTVPEEFQPKTKSQLLLTNEPVNEESERDCQSCSA